MLGVGDPNVGPGNCFGVSLGFAVLAVFNSSNVAGKGSGYHAFMDDWHQTVQLLCKGKPKGEDRRQTGWTIKAFSGQQDYVNAFAPDHYVLTILGQGLTC